LGQGGLSLIDPHGSLTYSEAESREGCNPRVR